MTTVTASYESVSPWWRTGVLLALILGFSVLIGMTVSAYQVAPPIPEKIVAASGASVFTGEDIRAGQQVFLKYGLMENGTIWGHGAYLGPDFSAEYLHTLGLDAAAAISSQLYGKPVEQQLSPAEKAAVQAQVAQLLKENRYDPATGGLTFSDIEAASFEKQVTKWTMYFSQPANNAGLQPAMIDDPQELRQLTAFFAWTAWASVANRPDKAYSYTNNFPYDPLVGNVATTDALIWSALSVAVLLGGLAVVLFAFGRWNFLGWKAGEEGRVYQKPLLVEVTASQRGIIKYFLIVAVLVFVQGMLGSLLAHYRADPASFYGIDLSAILPSNLVRTWHLQVALFWIATAYVAGALFLAPALSGKEPKWQSIGVNILFVALIVVVAGSLLGEWLGIRNMLGGLWFWFGNQGWEFLDLGRFWQILLAIGLVFWLVLLVRAVASARDKPDRNEMASLFMVAALGIPVFYLPALFFTSTTNYTIVDTWRFWIIHLWVEGFFELFATVMVAIIYFLLGIVSHKTATRVIYLDAILFLGSGIIGTGHHWYWTGQSNITMALGAVFSALEVVPLTLLTLDAWDFIKLTRGSGKPIPHKWAFYFLMAVGFWNFLGAGLFGFLINMPIVSYYEVGTMLTPNHGHAALMGVFGMLGLALLVFALRQVLNDKQWSGIERYIQAGFWGLNIGLLLMVLVSLFPGGVLQLMDVLDNGYWHARSPAFLGGSLIKFIEWARIVPDLVFGIVGVVPIVIAALLTYITLRKNPVAA